MNGAEKLVGSVVLAAVMTSVAIDDVLAYVTYGQGFTSKWGDPQFGNGAIVTWGYMLDDTVAHPSLPAYPELSGGSDISSLRTSIDATYGTGSFDTAIQNAFDAWSAVANINFVGPMVDTGLPAGQQGVTTPDIRIGAFHAVPESGFSFFGAIGYGPPGIITPANDFPDSGDIFINLDSLFQIVDGDEDETPIDWNLGNDIENLILHELGHAAIGLGHPDWFGEDPDQRVMYVGDDPPAPFCCQAINRELHDDDIAGAQYVYGLRGDYNHDGRVDAGDYVAWRNVLGVEVVSGTGADGNVDGVIDVADYATWKSHYGDERLAGFGEQPSFSGGAVPEPSAYLLGAIAATICYLTAGGWAIGRPHRSDCSATISRP